MADSMRYRFANWLSGGELERMRSWVLGAGSVPYNAEHAGVDNSQFSPSEYGNYIATSNAVYTCVSMRASFLARLKLRLYTDQDRQLVEVNSGPLRDLLTRVNPRWTFHRLMRMTSYSLDLWGSSYWFLERGQSGNQKPREIWWARPDLVEVVPDDVNYIKGFLYTPPYGGTPIFFKPEEAIWIVNPNPLDEFNGLAPLAAARLAADTASAGMQSNKRIFDQGMMAAGLVFPPDDVHSFTPEQARELERAIDARITGKDREHRLAVMRYKFRLDQMNLTPRDAEWMNTLKWSLEDVCRAYHWPLDLVGGQRTYENVNAALKAAWLNAVLPQADFIATEITEQLVPMFGAQQEALFDSTHIEVLQEDRKEVVEQMTALFNMGVPLNKLLKEYQPNLLPEGGEYAWGNVWWTQMTTVPIDSEEAPIVQTLDDEEDEVTEERIRVRHNRAVEYGSDEHERLWRRFDRRTTRWEKRFQETLRDLFRRQRDSVLDRLKARSRSLEDAALDPFDLAQWIKTFRSALVPLLGNLVEEVGSAEYDGLDIALTFTIDQPLVAQFIESRAQRFAVQVNQSTWDAIADSIKTGLQEGEALPAMESRLEQLFMDWMGEDPAIADKLSRVEMIARTEVVGASSGGQLQAWAQSGVVEAKTWLAALDRRTRDSHGEAHTRYQQEPIGLNEDFAVGGCRGPGPGLLGCADEDINCRCTMQPVVNERLMKMLPLVRANGYHKENGHE